MKKVCTLLIAVLMVFALVACGGGASGEKDGAAPVSSDDGDSGAEPAAQPGEPQYGGTLTLQYNDFNTVFDPAMGEQYVYSLWLENLFMMDWGLNDPGVFAFQENAYTLDTASGQIAKEWNWDAGKKEFTVTIRDDVYFQEKDAEYDIFKARNLTAEDVKYSYDRVVGIGSGFDEKNYVVIDGDWRERMNMLDSIEVTDEYTLVFKLNTASETKLSELVIAQINITGPEWDTLTDEQKNDWNYACGTGPYILTEFVPDNHYTFVKNEKYYGTDERRPENKLPYLDGIVLQKYKDSSAVMSSYLAGELNYVNTSAGLSKSEKEQLKNNSEGTMLSYPFAAPAIGLKCNNKPFSDKNVRVALQKAINIDEVNSSYYGYSEMQYPGLWSPALQGFSSVGEWSDELKGEYAYDPEAAKKLLADAGFADGFDMTVAIDPMADVDVFQLAKGYLAEVGVSMEIEVLADMMQGREVQGNPDDQRAFNFDAGGATDPGFAFQTFSTTGFAYNTFHGDTRIDELLAATRDAETLTDQQKAAKEMDTYFAEQHLLIAISGLTYRDAFVSEKLGGLENGELMDAYHFFKTIAGRIWEN